MTTDLDKYTEAYDNNKWQGQDPARIMGLKAVLGRYPTKPELDKFTAALEKNSAGSKEEAREIALATTVPKPPPEKPKRKPKKVVREGVKYPSGMGPAKSNAKSNS